MTKNYRYIIWFEDGTNTSPRITDSLNSLRAVTHLELTKRFPPGEAQRRRNDATRSIKELLEAEKIVERNIINAAKEKGKTAHLKKPDRPLGSTWAYKKQWLADKKAREASGV